MILERYGDQKILTEMLLVWPVYLENYLKSKMNNISCDLLYLPDEQKQGNINIDSYNDTDKFAKQMDNLLDNIKLDLTLPSSYICLSLTTSYYYLSTKMIADYFQKRYPETVLVAGGAHATARPNDEYSPIDFLILGEGERALYEIIRDNYKKQKKTKKIIGKPIEILDDLPKLDLSILNEYSGFYDSLSISLSRGCPFNCSFCMEECLANLSNKIKRGRAYSPKRAIEESARMIDYAEDFNIDRVGYVDPTFSGGNKEWMRKFIDLWDFDSRVSEVWIESRFDVLNHKMIENLQKKQFFNWYGLESTSKEMLRIMNKHINPSSYIKKYNEILEKHIELEYLAMNNVIFGHPGETKASLEDSFNGLKGIQKKDSKDVIQFSLRYYHHFPGSHVYNNIDYYEKKYGTKVCLPFWWEDEDLLQFGPYMVRPSADLSLCDLIKTFTKNYGDLVNISIDNLKSHKSNDTLGKVYIKKKEIQSFKELGHDLLNFIQQKILKKCKICD